MDDQGAVIILNQEPGERHHFHHCPECPLTKGPEDIYYAGKTARGVCHTHRYAWLLGHNIISGWKDGYVEAGRDWDEMVRRQEVRWQEIIKYRDARAREAELDAAATPDDPRDIGDADVPF
jgi:hypothetical protein